MVDHERDDAVLEQVCARAAACAGDVASIVESEIRQAFPLHSRDDQRRLAQHAVARLVGLGDLDVLLRDPTVDEVLVNAGCEIWVDRGGTLTSAGHLHGHRVEHLLERILAPIGRRVDRTAPIVDARLADGSRVCAVLPPVAVDGAVLSIRRFPTEVRAIDEFTDADGRGPAPRDRRGALQRGGLRRHVVRQDLAPVRIVVRHRGRRTRPRGRGHL